MVPVQPPPTTLEVVKMYPSGGPLREPGHPVGEIGTLEYPGGVQMGILYDLGCEATHKPFARFACLWKIYPLDAPLGEDDIFRHQEKLQKVQ